MNETKIKYVLYPGRVTSENDGDRHYIGYWDLVSLYRLKSSDCVHCDRFEEVSAGDRTTQFIHLGPKRNGDYTVPPPGKPVTPIIEKRIQ